MNFKCSLETVQLGYKAVASISRVRVEPGTITGGIVWQVSRRGSVRATPCGGNAPGRSL